MCGIIGIVSQGAVNQSLYDGLLLLQHRGQDAAGMVTGDGSLFHTRKDLGLVRDVFRKRDMQILRGNMGIAHCRYPTSGSASNPLESQPFYVNSPFGLTMAHNGNLVNTASLRVELMQQARHINTQSDSELLLNVLAQELGKTAVSRPFSPSALFGAVAGVHRRVQGAYAVVVLIAGYGLLAFRDPWGIRPLGMGQIKGEGEYVIASESVAINGLGYDFIRDIEPGEAIFISQDGELFSQQCATSASLSPCLFEYVYLARPDSEIAGISVYAARLKLGEYLAAQIQKRGLADSIDVVMPVPDSSRPSAMKLSLCLGKDYREGLIKNRYIGRTFIMPGQAIRKKSVRQKLNTIPVEFANKNILLVDDSIVRGTTSKEIVDMARQAGAKKVFLASTAPPVRYPNIYGIDMPSVSELIAHGRTEEDIAREIGVDWLVYQKLEDLEQSLISLNPQLKQFDSSCFTGKYLVGSVTADYLLQLEERRANSFLDVMDSNLMLPGIETQA